MSSEASDSRFLQIDEDGYFLIDGLRMADEDTGRNWISSLKMDDRGRAWCDVNGVRALIEAYDEPLIARDIQRSKEGKFTAAMPYGHVEEIDPRSFSLDEWDRFHGRTAGGVPFVLSRAAQARFFDCVDEFDDESITVEGQKIATPPWLHDNPDANQSSWWSHLYQTNDTRWELEAPAVALPSLVPRLKLPRSRILVAGAGSGNDAAWFAQQGHIVTAVDFSSEAIARAQTKYGHVEGLKLIQADVFNLPLEMRNAFDIVFEHTLYCAINPSRRNDLVRVWRQVLVDGGHLMGVFFVMDKPSGPPYGGSEYEIRRRLGKGFQPLYWTRLRDSISKRLGQELFVYARKVSAF